LGRIYEEVKGRPLYIVSEVLGIEPEVSRPKASGLDELHAQ